MGNLVMVMSLNSRIQWLVLWLFAGFLPMSECGLGLVGRKCWAPSFAEEMNGIKRCVANSELLPF